MDKYSFPVVVTITVNGPMTGKEINCVKEGMAAQINYLVGGTDFISDYVQERTASSVSKVEIVSAPSSLSR